MGPGVFTPGRVNPQVGAANERTLQWGRAFSRPEGARASGPSNTVPTGFNGAGRFHARKGRLMLALQNDCEQLQWGRAFSRPEGGIGDSLYRFFSKLQWGRAFSRPEGEGGAK